MTDLTVESILKPIIWHCDICDHEIADDDGWLTVNEREAWRLHEQWQKIDALKDAHHGLVPLSEIEQWPDRHVHWQSYHKECDPTLDDPWQYWFAIDRIRTISHVLAWNAHLHEKPWVAYTDWNDLLCERVAGGKPYV
jgi:hypothetical protein